MLQETQRDLMAYAKSLSQPYEKYSIDELANAYCEAVDTNNETLKNVYISALVLRFWYVIDKMYKANTVAPCLEREDFFEWLYEAIEYACKYRGWQDPSKNLNAKQCINKCIDTIKLQKYYNLRLDKSKTVNHCCSMDTPVGTAKDGGTKTLEDVLESDDFANDCIATNNAISIIQSYINRNKVVEAIILDNIAFNDVQRHFKKVIKTTNSAGEDIKYTEHSSEFWPYRLVQIVSQLPETYKDSFMHRYIISEEKLTAVLDAIDNAPNTRLYKYLRAALDDLRASYTY